MSVLETPPPVEGVILKLVELETQKMDPEKEKCPKSRNEAEKRIEVGMFSAPRRRPLPKEMVAGNVKI